MSITMTRMKAAGFLLMVFLSVVDPNKFSETALLNGTVTLPCNCSGSAVKWNIFSPIKARIAIFEDGMFNITKPFGERYSFSGNTSSGNFSMTISSIVFNDYGMYNCSCNGEIVSDGTLNVFFPWIMTATEGYNISLPCYGDTRENTKDIQWRKDGKELLTFDSAKPDKAISDRFSVSKEGIQDGNLSLQISPVNLSDAGVYQCLYCSESCEGIPRAVQLKVEKHQPATPPNSWSQYLGKGKGIVIGIIVAALLFAVGVIVYMRSKRPREETPVSVPIQEEFPMIPMKPSTVNPGHVKIYIDGD